MLRSVPVIVSFLLAYYLNCHAQSNKVIVLTIDGAIHPASADYIQTGIEEAELSEEDFNLIKLKKLDLDQIIEKFPDASITVLNSYDKFEGQGYITDAFFSY